MSGSIDWDAGRWRAGSASGDPSHCIVVAGDWAAIRSFEPLILRDPEGIYGDLLPVLRAADLRVVNLESALSDRGTPIAKDGPNLRGDPRGIEGLAVVPFDVACMANNHAVDYGPEALAQTLEGLRSRGIASVGAGMSAQEASRPLVIEVGETRLGVVNFSEGEDGTAALDGPGVIGWEPARVAQQVQELRQAVDVVMVIVHAGREYTPVPPPYIQRTYRAIAEAGASLVIGHHPHVPQGIEIHQGTPIVYSLGNFVFYQAKRSVFNRAGYLLQIGLADRRITELSVVPYAIGEEGLRQSTGAERQWMLGQLAEVSHLLSDPDKVRSAWEAFIDSFGAEFWRDRAGGVATVLERWQREPGAAAASMRNLFQTPAHHQFLADGIGRLIQGQLGQAPGWAKDLVERWTRLQSPTDDYHAASRIVRV